MEVFTENTIDHVEVVVRPCSVAASGMLVSPQLLDLGVAVVGTSKKGALTLSNPGLELIKWQATVEPSFFSLPHSSGLLNPGQAVTLMVDFWPGAAGPCKANLKFSYCPLKVGHF